jgi:hypothetical protein
MYYKASTVPVRMLYVLDKMSKGAVVACPELLSQHLLGTSEESNMKSE